MSFVKKFRQQETTMNETRKVLNAVVQVPNGILADMTRRIEHLEDAKKASQQACGTDIVYRQSGNLRVSGYEQFKSSKDPNSRSVPCDVTFPKPFLNIPTVTASLQGIDVSHEGKGVRVKVKTVSNVTRTGCVIEVGTWSTTILNGVAVAWTADDSTSMLARLEWQEQNTMSMCAKLDFLEQMVRKAAMS